MRLSSTGTGRFTLILGSMAVITSCGASSPPPDAFFDVTNDSYDAVDIYVGGQYLATLQPNTANSYDLGPGDVIYNVQIFESGDQNFELNDDDVSFPSGVTTWDVYDNAPVILVDNQFATGTGECANIFVDGQAQEFVLSSSDHWTPPSDTQICPQETGFFLVDFGTHTVTTVGVTSGTTYDDSQQVYGDGTHVTYTLPPS